MATRLARAIGTFGDSATLRLAARAAGMGTGEAADLCDGLTNTQIAQRLFVTRSTVEKHLGHAFDKLGVTSRHGLADLVAKE